MFVDCLDMTILTFNMMHIWGCFWRTHVDFFFFFKSFIKVRSWITLKDKWKAGFFVVFFFQHTGFLHHCHTNQSSKICLCRTFVLWQSKLMSLISLEFDQWRVWMACMEIETRQGTRSVEKLSPSVLYT